MDSCGASMSSFNLTPVTSYSSKPMMTLTNAKGIIRKTLKKKKSTKK